MQLQTVLFYNYSYDIFDNINFKIKHKLQPQGQGPSTPHLKNSGWAPTHNTTLG